MLFKLAESIPGEIARDLLERQRVLCAHAVGRADRYLTFELRVISTQCCWHPMIDTRRFEHQRAKRGRFVRGSVYPLRHPGDSNNLQG